MSLLKNKILILITLIFLAYVAWWFSFQSVAKHQGLSVQWYGATYGVMALIGSIIGFLAARKWGGYKTIVGRALMFFSLGLLAQEAGQIIYTYYVYGAKIEVPYPSWGDAAYFGSVLLYIYGAFLLAKAAGVKFTLSSLSSKIKVLVIPLALLLLSYAVFLKDYKFDGADPLKTFLDFGYPFGQAVYISIAILAYLLSRKLLGGLMKTRILFIISALLVQYIADFTFLYQVQKGTWYAGGWNDYVYLFSYFVMTVALLNLYIAYNQVAKE